MKEEDSTQVTPVGGRKGDLGQDDVETLSATLSRVRKERNEWRLKEREYNEEMKEKDQQMDDLKEDRKSHQGHEGKEEVQGQEQAMCRSLPILDGLLQVTSAKRFENTESISDGTK